MITEQSVISQVHADAVGNISVQRADQVLKDGKVISSTFHRSVLVPGDDLTDQDPKVQAIAAATWTPEAMQAKTAEIVALAQAETATRTAALDEADAAKLAAEAKQAEAEKAEADAIAAKAVADAAIAAIPVVPTPASEPAGDTVTDLQIRLALTEMGWRTELESAVKQADQNTQDWYDKARNFKRHDPRVVGMAAVIKKTDEEVNTLWALAATK